MSASLALRGVSADDTASFQAVRPRLFGIAARVLGSRDDADDVVQDAWVRWQGSDRSQVGDPASFLATATTRLAINVIQSARARRETPVGPERLEPVGGLADPAFAAAQRDALEVAVRTLLESLSPAERAVYLLREAFDYPYREIARALGIGEPNARQLLARARRRLAGSHCRPVGRTDRGLVEAFVAAAQAGELAALERALASDMDRGATV
jgi:RNA polymerase sigma-70 factor, ECF subfamily